MWAIAPLKHKTLKGEPETQTKAHHPNCSTTLRPFFPVQALHSLCVFGSRAMPARKSLHTFCQQRKVWVRRTKLWIIVYTQTRRGGCCHLAPPRERRRSLRPAFHRYLGGFLHDEETKKFSPTWRRFKFLWLRFAESKWLLAAVAFTLFPLERTWREKGFFSAISLTLPLKSVNMELTSVSTPYSLCLFFKFFLLILPILRHHSFQRACVTFYRISRRMKPLRVDKKALLWWPHSAADLFTQTWRSPKKSC